ncbi:MULTISPECIES: copper amine oxidase N-terminal domain-containing protein [Paenibacillus]|uniref:copper amine oxidase N-terminal domain-containing protein n=1 Tax=Paenibacillus TaxID=44249 RepID=UPI0022B937E3|nr:copper amine oxidase N-terminal domain-containing protein [Paenibacillus caseinilyticus]MCZ8522059.1 copper amine oxidase N-terminal domain-containing protein [Paenibacillus caseinilyticus]
MKKRNTAAVVGVLSLTLTMGMVVGTYADEAIAEITAHVNKRMTLQVDGTQVKLADGKEELAPIIYEGRSYVPAKPLAEALGAQVRWDEETERVIITTADKGAPAGEQGEPEASATDKPAEKTAGGIPVTYPADTEPSKIYDEYKTMAREGLTVYIYALGTADMDGKLKDFVYKYYPEDLAADSPEKIYQRASRGLEVTGGQLRPADIRKQMEDALAAVSSREFPDKSSGYDAQNGLTLHYQVQAGSDKDSLYSVEIKFVKEGNEYKLSDLVFIGTLEAKAVPAG